MTWVNNKQFNNGLSLSCAIYNKTTPIIPISAVLYSMKPKKNVSWGSCWVYCYAQKRLNFGHCTLLWSIQIISHKCCLSIIFIDACLNTEALSINTYLSTSRIRVDAPLSTATPSICVWTLGSDLATGRWIWRRGLPVQVRSLLMSTKNNLCTPYIYISTHKLHPPFAPSPVLRLCHDHQLRLLNHTRLKSCTLDGCRYEPNENLTSSPQIDPARLASRSISLFRVH
jgi:hypothetical protein